MFTRMRMRAYAGVLKWVRLSHVCQWSLTKLVLEVQRDPETGIPFIWSALVRSDSISYSIALLQVLTNISPRIINASELLRANFSGVREDLKDDTTDVFDCLYHAVVVLLCCGEPRMVGMHHLVRTQQRMLEARRKQNEPTPNK